VQKGESSVGVSRERHRVSDGGAGRFAEIVRNENVGQGNHVVLRAQAGQAACRRILAQRFKKKVEQTIGPGEFSPFLVKLTAVKTAPTSGMLDFPEKEREMPWHSRCPF
jgi:hypothetical protein